MHDLKRCTCTVKPEHEVILPDESMNSSKLVADLPDYRHVYTTFASLKSDMTRLQTSYKSKLLMNDCLNDLEPIK